jgi:hypothetical protein
VSEALMKKSGGDLGSRLHISMMYLIDKLTTFEWQVDVECVLGVFGFIDDFEATPAGEEGHGTT